MSFTRTDKLIDRIVVVGDDGPVQTRLLKKYICKHYDGGPGLTSVFENYIVNFM
jgi:hypothetical protein